MAFHLSLPKLARISATFAATFVQFTYNPIPAIAAPAPIPFVCNAVSVWDGDGPITCSDGRKVRLAGINAREIDGTCRKGHPCTRVPGTVARDALVQYLGGSRGATRDGHIRVAARLSCDVTGFSYGRVTAFCRTARGTDLSCAMVASGHAAIWRRHWATHQCARQSQRRPT